MSNIKDEIDWEFPGANTTQGQTNFFWEGVIRTSIDWAFASLLTFFQLPRLLVTLQVVLVTHSVTIMTTRSIGSPTL